MSRTTWLRLSVATALFGVGIVSHRVVSWLEESAPRPLAALILGQLVELVEEGVVNPGLDREAFLEAHYDDANAVYQGARQDMGIAAESHATLLSERFHLEEIEAFVPESPNSAQHLIFVRATIEGTLRTIPLDAGDWPDYYRRTRYGYGPRNALKSWLFDLLAEGGNTPATVSAVEAATGDEHAR